MPEVTPFLMFVGDRHGQAEAAVKFYVSAIKNSKVVSLEKYKPGEEEPTGTVKRARFTLNGREMMAMDSNAPHPFTFTPAVSLYLKCGTEAEVDDLFRTLSKGGNVLMEPGKYQFGRRFCWVEDRFGISWQLSYE